MELTWPRAALALLFLLGGTGAARAAEPGPQPTPPWAATVRAGVFVLRSPGVPGHPVGPDVEISLGRAIFDLVSVEVNAGAYTVALTGTGTQLSVVPVSVSLKLMAAPEHGFEAYAVAGLGGSWTRLSGGALASTPTSKVAYHAGLGVRRRFGPTCYAGLDGRFVFQDASAPLGRIDGLQLSALAGALF